MLINLLESLFGCMHREISWPVQPKGAKTPRVVCLKCSRSWEYSWFKMRKGAEIHQIDQPRDWRKEEENDEDAITQTLRVRPADQRK